MWTPVLSVLQQDGITLTDSAKLAAASKPTLTFTVARTGFIDGNPDVIAKWLEATNHAIGLVKTDPAVVAKAVGRQIGSSSADAAAQLKQNIYLDHAEQRGPEYFGTGDSPGQLAARLRDAAEFLHGQKKIEAVFLASRIVVLTDRPGRTALDVPITLPRKGMSADELRGSPEYAAFRGEIAAAVRAVAA